jgi:G:T/U-mismatch repair DNA glycosylase
MNSDLHPLKPFLPPDARFLLLGSFPPPRKLWSMEFYYPNLQNDMWRIIGLIANYDPMHFMMPDRRGFDRRRIEDFCCKCGLAIYDAAVEVIRLNDNASDNTLKVLREVDLAGILAQIPQCNVIIVTGGKAAEIVCSITGCADPDMGDFVNFDYLGRRMRLWRMPSTSRAFARPLEWKASLYRRVLGELKLYE